MDRMEKALNSKDKTIKDLKRAIENSEEIPPPPPVEKPKAVFKPVKGDEVDELLARILAELGCPIPIKRLGEGYYIFGTKKIYCKILNGQVMVRVGGGYMAIVEFVNNYTDVEMAKLEKAYEKGIDPFADEGSNRGSMVNRKNSRPGSSSFNMGSPGNRSSKKSFASDK
jgi:hypothetical protein